MLLNCHSYFSLCYGVLTVEELLNKVRENGYDSFVLSDINTTSACIEAARLCRSDDVPSRKSMKPIMGIDFRNGIKQQYVGIAQNNEGFHELTKHLSHHLHNSLGFAEQAPSFSNAFIVYPAASYAGWTLRENEYIGVTEQDLNRFPFLAAAKCPDKLVVLQTVSFATKKHFNAHRLLRAIDKNTLLSKLPVSEQALPDEIMPPKPALYETFKGLPQAISNTELILSNCSAVDFGFDKYANKNPKSFTGSPQEDIEFLRSQCMANLSYRYKKPSAAIYERLEKELDVIAQMKFASYFLINWDIVRYAQHKDYYYVGRGSGANSMVAYLLRITDVDPIKLDLYFERFINVHRTNPPDFDIDFSWTDREDMTKYIFDTYGGKENNKVALLGAYNTFKKDAVIRQLGKVFGLPPAEIDKLQSLEDSRQADELGRLVLGYSKLIHDFPSHLSVHSSGILISDAPITAYGGTFMPPKGYPTTQFSMLEAEDIGLYKFDILSQRGLGKIKDCLTLVEQNQGEKIDIHDVERFTNDEKVKGLLRAGKAIGCFYVESPAMRMLLAKLQADDYLRLVAASSIIRPGVAQSGMMGEYIRRFRSQEARDKARAQLPELYDLMEETYGVMVYQEDVIKVAHNFANLTLAESDILRRGMSWKFKQRNEFWKIKTKFFDNCKEQGHDSAIVEEIWRQIESFANFAFSKGHSASYAVESYQALFLKAYYPLEYMTATLNNGGGFYRQELYVHEAQLHGAEVEAPCVNTSDEACIIKGRSIFLGLRFITGLEKTTIEAILEDRRLRGDFRSLFDFIKRVGPSIEQVRVLIRAAAMRFTGKSKKELLWEAHMLINPAKKEKKLVKELFEIEPRKFVLPELTDYWFDDVFDEMELLGFSLERPFRLIREKPESKTVAADLKHRVGKPVQIIGQMIAVKNVRTIKGDSMYFGTFIDMEGQWIDTVHFPPVAKAYPFKGPGCYKLSGKVTEEFDFITLEVSEMHRLPYIDRELL